MFVPCFPSEFRSYEIEMLLKQKSYLVEKHLKDEPLERQPTDNYDEAMENVDYAQFSELAETSHKLGQYEENFFFLGTKSSIPQEPLEEPSMGNFVSITEQSQINSLSPPVSIFQSMASYAWDTSNDPVHNPVTDSTTKETHSESEQDEEGVHISIPECSAVSEGDSRKLTYHILVRSGFSSWEVIRSYNQFQRLEFDLSRNLSHLSLPILPINCDIGISLHQTVDDTRLRLEKYLQSLISIRDIWYCPFFDKFLNMSNFSLHLENIALKGQLSVLNKTVQEMKVQLEHALTNMNSLHDRIRVVIQDDNNNNDPTTTRILLPNRLASSSSSATTFPMSNLITPVPSVTTPATASSSGSSTPSAMGYMHGSMDPTTTSTTGITALATNSAPPSFPFSANPIPRKTRFTPVTASGVGVGVAGGTGRSPQNQSSSSSHFFTDVVVSQEMTNIPIEFQQSFLVTRSSIPTNIQTPSMDDIAVNDIIRMVEPCDLQVHFRSLVLSFASKVIRKSLNAKIFEMGSSSLSIFLPEDPICVSVILCRAHENAWYARLADKFTLIQSLITASEENSLSRDENPDFDIDLDDGVIFPITNIDILNDSSPTQYKVICQIANINFEIFANMKYDLVLTIIIEDFNKTIDKMDLLKKSILLIRAWWTYESKAYFPGGVLDTLSESAICVMILSIFNRFHRVIYYPLQAFGYFLSEYSGLEFDACVITLYGIVPFVNGLPDNYPSPNFELLLQPDQLKKYNDILNEQENIDGQNLAEQSPTNTMNYYTALYSGTNSKSTTNLTFERRLINIMHPLCSELNMITENITPVKIQNMILFMQESANMLQFAFDHSSTTSTKSPLSDYFRIITTTFNKGWRPDIPPPDSIEKFYDMLYVERERERERGINDMSFDTEMYGNIESDHGEFNGAEFLEDYRDPIYRYLAKLLDRIRYCNLIMEGRVSESSLLILCRDIIIDRGALPVGEVGKMLQEMTGMTSLSANLKEKFGGLKKFLEKYPNIFIICVDHPFNPHVFLKDTLTMDELSSVMSGIVPDHILSKLKKKSTRKKKSLPSSMSEMNSNNNNNNNMNSSSSTMYSQSLGPPAILSNYTMASAAYAMSDNINSPHSLGGGGGGGGGMGMGMGGQGLGQQQQQRGGRPTAPPGSLMMKRMNAEVSSSSSSHMSAAATMGGNRGGPSSSDLHQHLHRGEEDYYGSSSLAIGKATFPGAGAQAMRFNEQLMGGGGSGGGGGGGGMQQQHMSQMQQQQQQQHYGALPKKGQANILAARQRQMMVAWAANQQQGQGQGQHDPSQGQGPQGMQQQQQHHHQQQQQQHQQLQMQRMYNAGMQGSGPGPGSGSGSSMGQTGLPDPRAPSFFPKTYPSL
eukprot:gene815-1591_t